MFVNTQKVSIYFPSNELCLRYVFFPQGYQEKNKFIAAQGNARLFAAAKLFNWI